MSVRLQLSVEQTCLSVFSREGEMRNHSQTSQMSEVDWRMSSRRPRSVSLVLVTFGDQWSGELFQEEETACLGWHIGRGNPRCRLVPQRHPQA